MRKAHVVLQKSTINHIAFNVVTLSWDVSTDNVGVSDYLILRDGIVISSTEQLMCRDQSYFI